MTADPVRAVDLFCGAGGLSAGLALACEDLDRDIDLAAVNHWETAIASHEQNHPWADHYHTKVETVEPRSVVDDEVERGWAPDKPLQAGVYLSGQDTEDYGLPAAPVAADDELLQFAAEAMLWAAAGLSVERIVALSKIHTSLVLTTDGGDQRDLYAADVSILTYIQSTDPTLYRGFHRIRQMPGGEVYTRADEPRLRLSDLRLSLRGATLKEVQDADA